MVRLVQGRLDAAPEPGADGQTRLVTEDLQGTTPVPGTGQRLQPVLQSRRKRIVRCMAVGDERLVCHLRSWAGSWAAATAKSRTYAHHGPVPAAMGSVLANDEPCGRRLANPANVSA